MPKTATSASAATQASRRRGPASSTAVTATPSASPVCLVSAAAASSIPAAIAPPRAAHPPGGVQAADAEREEQRVDPGDVEPRARGEVGRGEHARGADPGRDAPRFALDQPGEQREAGERGHQRHQPQRQVGNAEHAGRGRRHVEVERRVTVGDVPGGRCRVQRLAGQDAVHLDERVALQRLDGERVVQADSARRTGRRRSRRGRPAPRPAARPRGARCRRGGLAGAGRLRLPWTRLDVRTAAEGHAVYYMQPLRGAARNRSLRTHDG